jgi:ribosomal-protein-alanine N-acetyltransferase
MINFGFNKLSLHCIEANVNPGNLHCIRLLEKNGFKKDAHLRENIFFNNAYIDSVIYTLLESD